MHCPPEIAVASSIAAFTDPRLLTAELQGQDLSSVIYELSGALQSATRIPELLPFYNAALNREYLCSTVLSHGLAFPHAPVMGISQLSFAFGKSARPLRWGSGVFSPVRFVFLIAVPAHERSNFLSLVSGLAQFAKKGELLQRLSEAASPAEIHDFFSDIKLPHYGLHA